MSSPNSAEVSGSPSPAPSSIGNNAPKYGTLVPNRIFVGGISASTSEQDLLELFSQYGTVKATKIISDRAGVSKGYGFVTFETEDEARRLTQEADNIMLKDRKLNIAPAIKKQVSDVGYIKTYSPRLVETNNSMVGAGGTVFFSNGATYSTYGSTVPVIGPAEYHPTFTQAPAAAPPPAPSAYQTFVYQQPMYYTQQYQYQPTQAVQTQWGAAPQWRWVTPTSYPQPECSSQCLVEPSSLTQKGHTAAAVGNSPYTSTSHILTTPSTSTLSISSKVTATISSTTVFTSPCASLSTESSLYNITTTTANVCDSLLLIEPLHVNCKPAPANCKSKSPPSLVSKTAKAVDDSYSSKVSKANEDTPSHIQQAMESELNKAGTSCKSNNQFSSNKSNSFATDNEIILTTHDIVLENDSALIYKVLEADVTSGDHQEQNPLASNVIGRADGDSNDECMLHTSLKSESISSVASNSSHVCKTKTDENMNNSISYVPSGTDFEMNSTFRHVSSCPQHGGEGELSPNTFAPQHMPSFIMVPSLTHLGKHTFAPKTTVPQNSDCVVKHQVTPPSLMTQTHWMPHNTSHQPLMTTEISTASQFNAVVFSPKVTCLSHVDGANPTNDSSLITTQASLVSATNTVTSNTRSICSPINNHSPYMDGQNSFFASYPGLELCQSYGYANQNIWMMMPSYPYWRSGVPCYHWTTPVYVNWPMTSAPLFYGKSTISATLPTHSLTSSSSPISSETLSNDLHCNLQNSEQKICENVNFETSPFKQGDLRSVANNVGETTGVIGTDTKTCVPPYTSAATCQRGKTGDLQKRQKGPKVHKSNAHSNCWSLPSNSISFPKMPDSHNYCQPIRCMRNITTITEAEKDDKSFMQLENDNSGLMPITPPPTPIFKSNSSSTIVNYTNAC